jgi:hypothetical protein
MHRHDYDSRSSSTPSIIPTVLPLAATLARTRHRPNGGVADSLDEAKAAFRGVGERAAGHCFAGNQS